MSSCEIGLLDYGFKISHISYRLVEARNLYLDCKSGYTVYYNQGLPLTLTLSKYDFPSRLREDLSHWLWL